MEYIVRNRDNNLWYIRSESNISPGEEIVRELRPTDRVADFPKRIHENIGNKDSQKGS